MSMVVLNKRYALNLRGINLSGVNFSGRTLIGVNLKKAKLVQTNFTGAKLQEINLISSNLKGAKMNFANLESGNLTNANLMQAELIETNLKNACLHGANFLWTQFDKVDLRGADLQQAKHLSLDQLINSRIDKNTRLPDYIQIFQWPSIVLKLSQFARNINTNKKNKNNEKQYDRKLGKVIFLKPKLDQRNFND